ncbi:hypothetical protein BH10ACT10_BH10ACT10_09020 [soil metagenome]
MIRRSHGLLRECALVLGGMLLLGMVCGVLWWLLVDPAAFTKLRDGGVMQEEDLSKQFSADGVYVVIAAVSGLVSGLLLIWWRTHDVLLTSVLLVLGTAVAAAARERTGHRLGPADPGAALAAAKVGARVPERLDVDAFTVYLAWPVSALVGALVVLLNVTPRPRSDSTP